MGKRLEKGNFLQTSKKEVEREHVGKIGKLKDGEERRRGEVREAGASLVSLSTQKGNILLCLHLPSQLKPI